MKPKFPLLGLDLIYSFLAALGLGAAVSAFSVGNFLPGWLAFGLLFWVCLFALLRVWRFFGAGKTLAALLTVAFFLRLVVAILVSAGLPIWGYDNPVNNAGFLYSDAYDRDQAAFKLATGNESLFTAFTTPDKTDQYGGLRFISAATYRALSPDADRALLISLLSAFMMALGTAFFWAGLQKRWSPKIAALAAWILVLFPDSVMLGSAQMREPFLIGLVCIAFWAVLDWQQTPGRSALIAFLALTISCIFSLPAGGIFVAILAAVLLLEWTADQNNPLLRRLGFIVLALVGLAALVAGWLWLRSTLYYDSYTTVQQSGWIQDLIQKYGKSYMIPFTGIYGLIQPVLPAAIVDQANLFWKIIAILRGLGWYMALPFLLYAFFAILKAKRSESKWLLVLFSLVFLVWVVVSSARAGGDQWDNPRYRYILLPFMALLIAWSLEHYRETRSRWFWRWVTIVAEFSLLFLNLYINRNVFVFTRLSLPETVAVTLLLAILILAGGAIWDFWQKKRALKSG